MFAGTLGAGGNVTGVPAGLTGGTGRGVEVKSAGGNGRGEPSAGRATAGIGGTGGGLGGGGGGLWTETRRPAALSAEFIAAAKPPSMRARTDCRPRGVLVL